MLRPRTFAIAAVLVAAIAAAAVAASRRDPAPPASDVTIGGARDGFHVRYEVRDAGGEPTIEDVWVRPPFAGRIETSTGSVQTSAMDRLGFGTDGDESANLVVARVPGLAIGDVRLEPILDDAVDAGLLEQRGRREILGRPCLVVRSGLPLAAGPLAPITDAAHVDTCVDADGLVLEEEVTIDGRPTLHKVAISVDLAPDLDGVDLDPGEIVLAADEGGGAALPVDPEAGDVGPFWVLPGNAPPEGFERAARLSVIPPQPEHFASNDPATVAGTADVFVRGADFVVVYQGGTLGRVDAFAPTDGATAIDGDALGDGELLLSARGSELRFPQARGRFVHVVGTLPPDELLAIARSLVETEGAGLVYLDR